MKIEKGTILIAKDIKETAKVETVKSEIYLVEYNGKSSIGDNYEDALGEAKRLCGLFGNVQIYKLITKLEATDIKITNL